MRASPGKNKRTAPVQRPSVSSDSFGSRSYDRAAPPRYRPEVRDLPPRRSLFKDYADSSSSRTGGNDILRSEKEVNSPSKHHRGSNKDKGNDMAPEAGRKARTYVRQPRKPVADNSAGRGGGQPPSPKQRKRSSKKVWVRVGEMKYGGEEDPKMQEKRQKVSSVFDRIGETNDKSVSPAQRDRRTQ